MSSYVEGGKFFAGLAENAKPYFSGSGALNPLSLILVSMLSTAFVAHFNAPKFYTALKDRSVKRCVCVCWGQRCFSKLLLRTVVPEDIHALLRIRGSRTCSVADHIHILDTLQSFRRSLFVAAI